MIARKVIASLVCFIALLQAKSQDVYNSIIPKPVFVEKLSGKFQIIEKTGISFTTGADRSANFLATMLRTPTGYAFPLKESEIRPDDNIIHLQIKKDFIDTTEGAYALEITPSSIIATAGNDKGLFYAVQTLRQMLPSAIESPSIVKNINWFVPSCNIKDAPRYSWRGYMKDVSRTFYSVDVVKKYLDVMALYKMNTFHFHLTDDQGWRIELKKHPEMTTAPAIIFKSSSQQPAYRSGYYTQEQIKDIVKYAAQRHIDIVPEIDVPGHCWPISIIHPELCVNKKNQPDSVVSFMDSYSYWGYQFTPNPLDPTKEEVYTFLDDVFTEVADLFPHKYIHFGGDEVRHNLWEEAPHVQAFMQAHQMKKIEELQSYFVQKVSRIITQKGKIPIGWNDILADAANLPPSTTIMSWLGSGAVKEAAKYGFCTVATPAEPLYFDISQDNVNDGTMVDWNYGGGDGKNGKGNTLAKVYSYNPEEGLTGEESKYILGVQANMWPAVAQEVKDINVQNFPRLLAVAEIGWTSPANKNYADFLNRLSNHYPRLDTLHIDYFKKGGYIIGNWDSSQITTTFKTKQWNVTPKVYAAGRIQAGFLYTGGKSFLKIRNVKLLENGKVVASDDHLSVADKFRATPFKKDMFFYVLQLKKYNPKAKYTLQAEIAGEKDIDSKGNITFNLSPEKPFTVVERLK